MLLKVLKKIKLKTSNSSVILQKLKKLFVKQKV